MADENVAAESNPEPDVLDDPEVIDDLVHLGRKRSYIGALTYF